MTLSPQSHAPSDLQALTQLVQSAAQNRTALQIVGAGTKRSVGHPGRQTIEVSMTRFDSIIDYDPSELVLTVGAGVRLATLQTLLAEHEQMLAFDPFDFALISGAALETSTIGGVVAAGFAGSRRLSAGNVRDHVLGFTAVSGRGEAFVAGGRVVKNVTGYDVSKLMCGSWGQLAVLTQVTLKVLPRARTSLTLQLQNLDAAKAFAAMTLAVRSQADVAAAAYVPAGLIDEHSHTWLRLEGFGPSVEARAENLAKVLGEFASAGALERLDSVRAESVWSRVSSGVLVGNPQADAVLWRICIPSTAGAGVCARLRELDGVFCVDWGGGLIWARLPIGIAVDQVRGLAESAGGHATMLNAPLEYREKAAALHPERPGVAALTQRVKAAFDPAGILDPLRFSGSTP